MKTKFHLRELIAGLMLLLLTAPIVYGADIQVTFTQNQLVSTTQQPAATGTFEQLSPEATGYILNSEFKFFISLGSVMDPVLGTVAGLLFEVIGGGCEAADYVGISIGGVVLIGDPAGCDGGTMIKQFNAATDAGASGVIIITSLPDVTFLNLGLESTVAIPIIFISSVLADSLIAQLNNTEPPPPPVDTTEASPIPTLSPWGIMILSVLLILSIGLVRRRHR